MPTKTRSYSDMQAQLAEIVAWFESSDFDLDRAVSQYETAQKLVAEISNYLKTVENKVTKLKNTDQ